MLTVECYRSWDAALWRTDKERPLGAVAALVGWTAEPARLDGGPPVEIERIVSQVCAALGSVAFRLFFDCDLSQSATIVRTPRKWALARAWEGMTRRSAADIAIVTNARDAREMFEQGWPLQGQTALILEVDACVDTAVDMLSRLRDWRGHRLPSGVSLLVAPAVDGDAIMLAAKTDAELNPALSMLEHWCGRENVPFRYAAPHDGSDDRGTPG
jgi:hypothetical protein